jgi:hypothetical protein
METTTITENTTSVKAMVQNAIKNHNNCPTVINWDSSLGEEIIYAMEQFCELGVFDNKTQREINDILWYLATVGREGVRNGKKAISLGKLTK